MPTQYEIIRDRMAARRGTRPTPRSWMDTAIDGVKEYGSGLKDSAVGMVEGVGDMLNVMHGDPTAVSNHALGAYDSLQKFRNAGTADRFKQVGVGGAEQLTGIPFSDIGNDIQGGHYARAAGKATLPIGLLGLGAHEMMKAPPAPKPKVPLQLAERNGPRFYSGEAGVADSSTPYQRHTGNPNPYLESGTQTLGDIGEVVTLPPELAAQGYGPGGRPPVSIGKARTRMAHDAAEGIKAERLRKQPTTWDGVDRRTAVTGRQQVTDAMQVEEPTARVAGPARQTPGIPSVEKVTTQSPFADHYSTPGEDPNVRPGRLDNIDDLWNDKGELRDPKLAEPPKPVKERAPAHVDDGTLPAGTQSRLREMGIPEEQIRSMDIKRANKVIQSVEAATKRPTGSVVSTDDAAGGVSPAGGKTPPKVTMAYDNEATRQVKADSKAATMAGRPYGMLSDGDLLTLSTRGDVAAIREAIARKRGEVTRVNMDATSPQVRPGDVSPINPTKASPSFGERLKATLTDETGSIPRRPVPENHPFEYNLEQWKEEQRRMGATDQELDEAVHQATEQGIDPTRSDDLYDLGNFMDGIENMKVHEPEGYAEQVGAGNVEHRPLQDWHAAQNSPPPEGFIGRLKDTFRDESGSVPRRPIEVGAKKLYNTAEEAMPDLARERYGKAPEDLLPNEYWPLYEEAMDRTTDLQHDPGTIDVPKQKTFPNNEEGKVDIQPGKTVNFDKPIMASEKGNLFHRTVNPVFDRHFENWVNARRATKIEGIIKRREFADLDAHGFEGIKAFQAGMESPRFKAVTDYLNQKHDTLSQAGVRLGFKENYLPQLWENGSEDVFKVQKRLGLKPSFTMKSVLENYQKGVEAGLTPKYKTIGELAGWYEEKANKAIADRQFFDHLLDTKQILPDGKAPQGWASINPDNFPVQKFKTKRGDVHTKNYKAPPDVAKAINNYLGEGHEAFRWVGDKASITKNIVLSSGVPKTAINAHGFNIAARNVMANGLIKGGVEAAKYLIHPNSAGKWFSENIARAPEAVKYGLSLTTEDHQMGSPGSAHLLREPQTRPGKFVNKGFNYVLSKQGKWFEDPLFQNVVPALKLKHWMALSEDMAKGGMNPEAAKRAAATTTNELYGGINWEAMQRSRDWQNLMRGIILAPDWFETQYRIGKGMANTLRDPRNPRGLPWKRAAASLIGMYVSADVVNYGLNGKHMWENESGHELDIKAGNVGGKTRYIRPFGTAADFARLPFEAISGAVKGDLSGPVDILKNRFSTVARPSLDLVMNTDPFGNPIFGPDKYGHPQTRTQQLGAAGREVAGAVMPQYIKGPVDYAAGRVKSKEEMALGVLEAPVRYARESTKRTSRHRPVRRRASR